MKHLNFRVRRAESSDLEQLISFTAHEFREAEGNAEAPDTISHGVRTALEDDSLGMYWVLVKDDSQVIGNVSVIKEWSDWLAGYYWWIQSMYIQPNYRGIGLMEKLLDAVKAAARDEAVLKLRLYVHKMNARAITAYRKSGFFDADYQIMRMKL
ncbi:MAG: GNAT family N-acetyltransferase [Candidatus Aminicenantes bacterium]|nr:GNAT family N-acetyltransferase [Candidatus Aminicenantes bacterium]